MSVYTEIPRYGICTMPPDGMTCEVLVQRDGTIVQAAMQWRNQLWWEGSRYVLGDEGRVIGWRPQ